MKIEQEEILANPAQSKLLLFVCERVIGLETSCKCGNIEN